MVVQNYSNAQDPAWPFVVEIIGNFLYQTPHLLQVRVVMHWPTAPNYKT